MRADDDVDMAFFQLLQDLLLLFGALESVEVFDIDRETVQAVFESLVML